MKPGFSLCSVLPIHPSAMERSLPSIGPAHPYRGFSSRLQVGGVAQVLLSPWRGELGAVLQGTLEAIWDISLSLLDLMNGVRLPSWQCTSSGSAVDQTAPEHALTCPAFLWMSLPLRGDLAIFSFGGLGRNDPKVLFLPRQTGFQVTKKEWLRQDVDWGALVRNRPV